MFQLAKAYGDIARDIAKPVEGTVQVAVGGTGLGTSAWSLDAATPDPLIEAVEEKAPAYRTTAYVVFEDLPLGPFGNRTPQLSFEVFRRPIGAGRSLEDRLEGVCLIPGAGEFCLADEAVLRRDGLTRTVAENVNNGEGRPDLLVSLDQLEAQCPNLKRVSLIVGWFGDDLRAAHCRIRPGVERRDKLLSALEATAAERDGRIALIGPQAEVQDLTDRDLALGDDGAPVSRTRDLEARPSRARMRFIDEAADYQVGSVVRTGDGEGGGVDLDLPMVCGRALAETVAEQLIGGGGPAETRTAALAPEAALRLEIGDVVRLPDEAERWRVDRIDLDETPTARLSVQRRSRR